MTKEYEQYLKSEAWKQKRYQRLSLSHFQCAACGSKHKSLHVHHLTYAHIFNEPMEDLLPLCEDHHDAAEKLVKKGKLPRTENVLFLATETIRLLCRKKPVVVATPIPKPVHQSVQVTKPPPKESHRERKEWRRRFCNELMSDKDVVDGLGLERSVFIGKMRSKFANHPRKASAMWCAANIYDRYRWKDY